MPRTPNVDILRDATQRDFSGGLNVSDSDLNLSSRYAQTLNNLVVANDGSLLLRQGCRLFADLSALTPYPIRNVEYYLTYLIAVDSAGQVFAINGQSVATVIWNAAIAGAKGMWASTSDVLFLEFNGELIITNGQDKPLVVTSTLRVDYLADKATGSNINVPVALLIEKFSQHCVMASGSMLYVSERNASGTWYGDSGTQFANNFDMKTYVTKGDTNIVGLAQFKGYLLVRFRECVIPVQFVENTTPANSLSISVSPDSIIENYGSVSHRTQQPVEDGALSCDIVGVSSVSLSKFTRILSPNRPSRLIDPALQRDLNRLSVDAMTHGTFAVYHRRLSMYMLAIPDGDRSLQLNSNIYAFRSIDELKVNAWMKMTGWNWCAGARSSEGRMFFVRNNSAKIFVLGDKDADPINADYMGEQETFSDGTYFTDRTGLTPVHDLSESGLPIPFEWELPWSDFKHRSRVKTFRHIILDTEGSAEFTMQFFVDRFLMRPNDGEVFSDGTTFTDSTGFIPFRENPYTPALQIDFVGGDAGGYGYGRYGTDLYGGGNNTSIAKMTFAPTKFNLGKFRFKGESRRPLKIVAITPLYQIGSVRRFMQ